MGASRTLGRVVVGAVAVGLVVGLVPAAAQAKPRNPSDGEITAAQLERSRKAAEVGRLTGLVAQANGDMRRATDEAELAVERYNKAVVDLERATTRARVARTAADRAERQVTAARGAFSDFARASYKQGSTVGSITALVDATGPTDLLQRADLLSYAGKRRLDAVGRLDRAKVRRANAESTARKLLAEQQAATVRAEKAKVEAARKVADARSRLVTLQAQRTALNAQLEKARIALNGLLAERQRYRAWQKAEAIRIAKERERLRKIREAAARRAAAAAAAARAAAARAASGRGSRSGGSSGSSSWTGGGRRWTAARGQWVADAALRWLGMPYAWGGGNRWGPTRGVNGPGAGWNDSTVIGFDCSGLALWAWAQVGIFLPHYSGYQYSSGRRISSGNLRPGDLVFWAYDTYDPSTIHHVAIYIGGGRVVQAPQSGDVVRISPMWYAGYIGAARPGA